MKKVLIDYLYIDLKTCDRCLGTDKVLRKVLAELVPALKLAGYKVYLRKVEIATPEMAQKYCLVTSPTIRVNGHDICKSVEENNCSCCSEISNTSVNCRVFVYKGKKYETPPQEMLADAILKAIFRRHIKPCQASDYVMPANLKAFFAGKADKLRNKRTCC